MVRLVLEFHVRTSTDGHKLGSEPSGCQPMRDTDHEVICGILREK
jgi:hypothetical protein